MQANAAQAQKRWCFIFSHLLKLFNCYDTTGREKIPPFPAGNRRFWTFFK